MRFNRLVYSVIIVILLISTTLILVNNLGNSFPLGTKTTVRNPTIENGNEYASELRDTINKLAVPETVGMDIPIKLKPKSTLEEAIIKPSTSRDNIAYTVDHIAPSNITIIKLPYSSKNIKIKAKFIGSNIRIGISRLANSLPKSIEGEFNSINIYYSVHSGIDPVLLQREKLLVIQVYSDGQSLKGTLRLHVTYQVDNNIFKATQSSYDVLIITSKKLAPAAAQLEKIKEKAGYKTLVGYVEDIYSSYSGRDYPEKIRNFIKHAVNVYNIKYVIILGDSDVVPVRYAYIPDGAFDDNSEIDGKFVETDLYYADLDYTWNDNNDSLWGDLRYDRVDGFPDVFVGRIPVDNLTEAYGAIRKIENYKPVFPLYSKVLFAGADTFQIGYPEGEYLLDFSQKFVRNMTITKIYETYGNLTRDTFMNEINKGKYLVAFTGHGLPDRLALTFSQTYGKIDALAQINKVYPIFVALSCDAVRFANYDGIGETMVLNSHGGVIAFIGSTRIAWGYIGELVTQGFMGELLWRTIRAIYNKSIRTLGEVWADTIKGYIEHHPIQISNMGYYLDWKTVAEYVLLGDPTLEIKPVIENLTENNDKAYTNEEVNITTPQRYGYLSLDKTNMTIRNTYIIANTIEALDSRIILINSTIIAEEISLTNSSMTAVDSEILSFITMSNSQANISSTILSRLKMDEKSSLIAKNSSMELIKTNITALSDWIDGINSINLTDIGLNGKIVNTYVMLQINISNIETTISNSEIGLLEAYNANISIVDTEIVEVRLSDSSFSMSRSNVSLTVIGSINGTYKINSDTTNIVLGKTKVTGTGKISAWRLYLSNSNISLINSTIAIIQANNSFITASNLNLSEAKLYSSAMNGRDIAGLGIYLYDSQDISLENVSLGGIYSIDTELTINNTKIIILNVDNSTAGISKSRIYDLYAKESTVSITDGVIVEANLMANTTLSTWKVRSALLDVHAYSKAYLNETKVLYWLRVYDHAYVEAARSTIWFGLTFFHGENKIEGLTNGHIKNFVFSKQGWLVNISKTEVLNWDIISYGAEIGIVNSTIGWVFLYRNSTLNTNQSNILLVRGTHQSKINIIDSAVTGMYLSANSQTQVEYSYLGTIYLLGHANFEAKYDTFDVIAGLALNATAKIINCSGGTIAAIQGTKFFVRHSKVTLYLVFTNWTETIENYYPQYYQQWSSEGLKMENSSISVEDSWVSWILDVEESKVTIRNSLLVDLYLMNATATIDNVKVGQFTISYGSNATFINSTLYQALVWASSLYLEDSTVAGLHIVESYIIAENSAVMPLVYLLEGNYHAIFKPGFYENANLTQFINPPPGTMLIIRNSSIMGWGAFALGMEGHVNLTVDNSVLMAVGAVYNASIFVRNTYLYGYAQVYLTRAYNETKAVFENTRTRLYLTTEGIKANININSSLNMPYSGELLGRLFFTNTTIYDTILGVSGVNITINGATIDELEADNSNVTLVSAKISTLKTKASNITITDSKISSFTDIGSTIVAKDLQASLFVPFQSTIDVEDSHFAAGLYLSGVKVMVHNLRPLGINNASVPTDIPLLAQGRIVNSYISGWVLRIGEFSELVLSNSVLRSLVIDGFATNVEVDGSTIDSLKVFWGEKIVIKHTKFGLDLNIKDADATLTWLKTGRIANRSIIVGGTPESINVYDSYITAINVTVYRSKALLSDLNATLLILNGTTQTWIENSTILETIGRMGDYAVISNSWTRILNPGIGGQAELYNSEAGVVRVFMYGNETLVENPDSHIVDKQTNSRVNMHGSKLIDTVIYAAQVASIVVRNINVFFIVADGISRVTTIDTMVEYPLEVIDFARVEIKFTLEIQVNYDFSTPQKASIHIEGQNISIDVQAINGKYSTILYQGIVTPQRSIDLGRYTITAKVGGFSASKTIYLWKPTKVEIFIAGPITWIIIIAGLASIVFIILKFIEKRRRRDTVSEVTNY